MWRESEHLFFKLGAFEADAARVTSLGRSLQTAVRAKLDEWFEAGLQDWDISRDAPYFGFEMPGRARASTSTSGSTRRSATSRSFEAWRAAHAASTSTSTGSPRPPPSCYHFIGKDISYFHTLFWPAVLHGAGLRRPTGVYVHGFLTINGQKMSKSRGTFITARRYLERLPPEPLRYYFAAKLSQRHRGHRLQPR